MYLIINRSFLAVQDLSSALAETWQGTLRARTLQGLTHPEI